MGCSANGRKKKIFHQTPLHVLGVSTAHHQEARRKFTTVGTNCLFRWLSVVLAGLQLQFQPNHDNRQPSKKIISTNCCRQMACLLMMGGGYTQNVQRCMMKYIYIYISVSKRFSMLSDTQTPLLRIFPLAFIQASFVHGLPCIFHPVFLRSSLCSLLFRHPLQCI